MPKSINVDKILCPGVGKLVFNKNETLVSSIADEELDEIRCLFHNDNCVELRTEGYSFLTLSKSNLIELVDLIDKAKRKYARSNLFNRTRKALD